MYAYDFICIQHLVYIQFMAVFDHIACSGIISYLISFNCIESDLYKSTKQVIRYERMYTNDSLMTDTDQFHVSFISILSKHRQPLAN